MCGISGFLNYDNHRELATAANEIQKSRGPDANGIWSNDFLSISHQRLSIIDLDDRSNQPMLKRNLVIAFNGEIYNYKELKSQLQKDHGTSFKTNSDTEVILELFAIYGINCLSFLIGMFAVAIYDSDSKTLFLARDHFGIKPLYFTRNNERFAFSSELKTLKKLVGQNFNLSNQALAASMQLLWLPDAYCIFEEVHRLMPGHYATINQTGMVNITAYWQLEDKTNHNIKELNEPDAIEYLATEFEKSIERHLVADVEVGSFLSGGLDSSLISVAAAQKTGYLRTFTIGMSEKDKKIEKMADDQYYAELLAEKMGFNHESIVADPDIVSLLPQVVYNLDEPIGDPAALNSHLICKTAHDEGLKVLLSGMGSDEIFFGYRRQKALAYAQKYKDLPKALRAIIKPIVSAAPVKLGSHGIRSSRWAKKFLTFAELPNNDAYLRSYSQYTASELAVLMPNFKKEQLESLSIFHNEVMDSLYQADFINNLCQTDIKLFMSGLNLTYTDRSSMANSMEVRVPFIDKNFVEAAMQINSSYKFQNNSSKSILKKMAERYLPKEIIYRPKSNFALPTRRWLSNELSEMVNDLLSKDRINSRGWFNSNEVDKIIKSHNAGWEDNSAKIYQMLTIELWAQNFLDN
ncbi:asparagine synthase (glutamine-hydrolyzing) [Sneathiella limimaris]|uniref:asparagine synthase (glutamine-hydrolyzing) n=1 Tax=Sneathiella limimaris TaxID=1964213 RepID=UPI00146CDAC1|nr:asparagine synthase (glutamine-hydrolyzing) [Sneathiella limimaris]